MKKEILATLLLIIIFALSLWNSHALTRMTNEISDTIRKSRDNAENGDWEAALYYADKAISTWQSKDPYTHIVLRHSDIDTMTNDFYEFLEHLYCHDTDSLKSSALLVISHLDSIQALETIRLGSVF